MPVNLIVEILSALIISILIFTNWKAIKLLAVRVVFGRFSWRYFVLYKAKFMRYPNLPCIQDDLIIHCFNFIDINPEKKFYYTNKEIAFGSLSFYSKFSAVKGRMPSDCFNVFKLSKRYIIKIVGFKTEYFGNKIMEAYYFINNIFFLGEYSFADVSAENCEKLKTMLSGKYEIAEPVSADKFYIRDNNDSLIYFENNGFTITIQYSNLRKPMINNVWDTYFKNVIKNDSLFTSASKRNSSLKL